MWCVAANSTWETVPLGLVGGSVVLLAQLFDKCGNSYEFYLSEPNRSTNMVMSMCRYFVCFHYFCGIFSVCFLFSMKISVVFQKKVPTHFEGMRNIISDRWNKKNKQIPFHPRIKWRKQCHSKDIKISDCFATIAGIQLKSISNYT